MRRPRHDRMPVGRPGVWHLVSRCVRRTHLLEAKGRREWLSERIASWCGILALDLLGYALMGNHLHLVIRTRPDRSAGWSVREVATRMLAACSIHDGSPSQPDKAAIAAAMGREEQIAEARLHLSHPGVMMRSLKEGFARKVNLAEGAAGHVWESRYQDVAVIDAGGVLACLVYVDLNPFRAGLVADPARSDFCSARHRLVVDASAPDAALGACLHRLEGHPLLDGHGQELGAWSWTSADVAELTAATARLLRREEARLPTWAEELLPRLGVAREFWPAAMGRGGTVCGSVMGSLEARRRLAGTGRLASDKTGLFY